MNTPARQPDHDHGGFTLTPGSRVDLLQTLERFFSSADLGLCENPHSLVKGMVNRALDAAAPSILEIGRLAGEGRDLSSDSIQVAAFSQSFPKLATGFFARLADGSAYLFSARLSADPASPVSDVAIHFSKDGDIAALARFEACLPTEHAIRIYEASPSRRDSDLGGNWTSANLSGSDPCAWIDAFEAFGVVAASAGQTGAIAARAAEIGERTYVEIAIDGNDALLCEAAQALALLDGGIPGRNAAFWVRGFQAEISARLMTSHLSDIESLADSLLQAGHTSQDGCLEFGDEDVSAFCLVDGNRRVLCLTDGVGALVVSLHRTPGLKLVAVARCADDEIAEAVVRLRTSSGGFPGFRGAFVVRDGAATLLQDPPLTREAVNDAYVLGVLAESGCGEFAPGEAPLR